MLSQIDNVDRAMQNFITFTRLNHDGSVGRLARRLVIGWFYRQEDRGAAISRLAPRLRTMATPRSSCLSRVKGSMSGTVKDLLSYIDLNEVRFRWPSNFIFFCGGQSTDDEKDPVSLRHYLLKERNIGRKINAEIVLAEAANQLYRDTDYKDLISYEEDIAKISSIVLLIAESAGSLSELGAFVATDHLRQKLYVIMQEQFHDAESFVRFGPIKRLENEKSTRVAFYPWRVNGRNRIVKSSIYEHVPELVNFVNLRLSEITQSFKFGATDNAPLQDFLIVLWLTHVSQAITREKIREYSLLLGHEISNSRIDKCFYCMKLAGWMDKYAYSGSRYYYTKFSKDFVERFSFQSKSPINDSRRWLSLIQPAIVRETSLTKPFLKKIMERKDG